MNENLVDNSNMETYSKSKKSEKEFVNFYINIPFRRLAKIIVSYVHRYNITPNMISILGIFVVAVGGILLVLSDEHNSWRAIPFFISIGLFSALDGTLARKKEIFSPFGSWIGMVSERVEYMLIGLSFSWYIYAVTGDHVAMYLAFLAYVFREGIGTLSTLTIGKMPPNWKELYNKDFSAFKNLNSHFLMTAHVLYKKIDSNFSATHSRKIINTIIRKKFKFKGLIISDDISMKALSSDLNLNAKNALNSGCNLVLYCKGEIKESKSLLKNLQRIDKFTQKKTYQFYDFLR